MLSKRTAAVLLIGLLAFGCAFTAEREKLIRSEHPQWPEETVRKLASRQIEPGMTREMVRASLGKPDRVSEEGREEVWGYAVWVVTYSSQYQKLVYFVHFKEGRVTRTVGDPAQLRTLM